MIGANFNNANLIEADLTSANIIDVNFEGANLNNTIWPDGRRCGIDSIGKCN